MTQSALEPISLPIVNRDCIVLLPTQAYLDWAQTCPEGGFEETLEELRRDGNAYLIPEQDVAVREYLLRNYRTLLDQELLAWCTDTDYWPNDRSYHTFERFFDIQYCSLIFDLELDPLDRT